MPGLNQDTKKAEELEPKAAGKALSSSGEYCIRLIVYWGSGKSWRGGAYDKSKVRGGGHGDQSLTGAIKTVLVQRWKCSRDRVDPGANR